MKILALETTEMVGSLAAMDDGNLLLQQYLRSDHRSARSLAPGIKSLIGQVGWRAAEVDLVAVTVGPGSFTGLRVGVTTAKTFAYAVGAEVLGIDTLEAIAAGAPESIDSLSVAIDAQRGEVVAGCFRRDSAGQFRLTEPSRLIDLGEWLDGLPPDTVVSGPILRKCADRVPEGVRMLDAAYWPPQAATLARLAARDHAAGRRDDLWSLVPRYSRRSAAEEKWEQDHGS